MPYVAIASVLLYVLAYGLGMGPIPYFIGSGKQSGAEFAQKTTKELKVKVIFWRLFQCAE